ncbi:Bifunctional IPC transferase and DIPP synthase [compost metagenome]
MQNMTTMNKLKAVILAAGKGTRIHALTDGGPKSLLPLGDTTLLGQSLRHFAAQGIEDLVIVTGYRRDAISEYVRREWSGNLEIVFNPHYDTTNVLYSFWLAMPYLAGSDFLFLHADTVFSQEILERVSAHEPGAQVVFAVDDHPCEDEEMKVQITDGRVTVVTKQMPHDSANGEFLGLARISADALPGLRAHAEQLFEEGAFSSFFEMSVQRMIDEDGLVVKVADVTGMPWREVDFPEDYAAAQEMFG